MRKRLKALIAIPARYGSTRLPGKPLLEIGGEPMVVRVWRRCLGVRGAERVLVATDDRRIVEALREKGAEVVMTSPGLATGTDRVAEAVRGVECDLVVNVQGDEPFLDTEAVGSLIDYFDRGGTAPVATLASPVRSPEEIDDRAVVKVVVNLLGEAMYFSRLPIPFRSGEGEGGTATGGGSPSGRSGYLRHVGVYAFRPRFLQTFSSLTPTPAERAERLEQLRILENGEKIHVVIRSMSCCGVDTPEDLARARARAVKESQ